MVKSVYFIYYKFLIWTVRITDKFYFNRTMGFVWFQSELPAPDFQGFTCPGLKFPIYSPQSVFTKTCFFHLRLNL